MGKAALVQQMKGNNMQWFGLELVNGRHLMVLADEIVTDKPFAAHEALMLAPGAQGLNVVSLKQETDDESVMINGASVSFYYRLSNEMVRKAEQIVYQIDQQLKAAGGKIVPAKTIPEEEINKHKKKIQIITGK